MPGIFLNPGNIVTKTLHYWSRQEEDLPFFLGKSDADLGENVIVKDFVDIAKEMLLKRDADTEIKRGEDDSRFKFQQFLLRMLEVLDFFERVFEGIKNEAPGSGVITEFERIYTFLKKELTDSYVEKFPTRIGDMPKPERHKVISREAVSDVAAGAICKVVKEGYQLESKVLRKASVITAE